MRALVPGAIGKERLAKSEKPPCKYLFRSEMSNQPMIREQRRSAKAQVVAAMNQGQSWQKAVASVGLPISRATAYRWQRRVQVEGETALQDHRHGHVYKLREPYANGWSAVVGKPHTRQATGSNRSCGSSSTPTSVLAIWKRLAPFFRLAGRVRWEPETVRVELRPFNDAQLNRDLNALCTGVATAQPRLPDRRRLVFTVQPPQRLSSELYQRELE